MEYEVVVFENNAPYDSRKITDLSSFVEICRYYMNPEYTEKEYVSLWHGGSFISYSDKSGNDKAMNIVLVGKLKPEDFKFIEEELKKFYETS